MSLKDGPSMFFRKSWQLINSARRFFRKIRKIIFWGSALIIGLSIAVYIYFFYIDRSNMPDIKPFIEFEPPIIGLITDSQDQIVIELAQDSIYRRMLNYDQIPPVVRNAILSAEDSGFFSPYWARHHGIDYLAVARAGVYNTFSQGRWLFHEGRTTSNPQGASTLTQQIVRLYFLPNITRLESSDTLIRENAVTRIFAKYVGVKTVNKYHRKIIEIKYSIWLERELKRHYGSRTEAKKQIFARFANYTYFGNGRYGVDTASEFYFGKKALALTEEDIDKAALLAGMIKNPAAYGPRPNQSEKTREIQKSRRNQVINLMAEEGYITGEEKSHFSAKEIVPAFKIERTVAPSVVNQTFVEVKNSNFKIQSILGGNINIQTTVDLRIQKIVNEACENGLTEYEKRYPEYKGQTQCSAIAMKNSDASILAEVGGRKTYQGKEYQYSDLNRVNRARQAGSAFKPFVYLTAFNQGFKSDDKISDAPYPISMGYGRGLHWVNNYDNKSLGTVTLCEALYRSRNTPTVRLVKEYIGQGSFEESGMKQVIDMTRLLGIKSPYHTAVDHLGRTVYYPTSALGASEMTVTELANAYREIASGLSAEPHIIQKITGRNGQILFQKQNNEVPSQIDPEALKTTLACLRKVVTQPGGTAYSLTAEKFPVPIAGKTGTTDDFRNALFAGSTYGPEGITIVARVDFDDNRELGKSETGARTALPIVKEIFKKIYEQNLVGPAPDYPEEIENPTYNPAP